MIFLIVKYNNNEQMPKKLFKKIKKCKIMSRCNNLHGAT